MHPPAEKVPMSVRREVRDKWESKKDDFSQKLSEALGVPWSFEFNLNLVYANCDLDKKDKIDTMGQLASEYAEGLIDNIHKFIKTFGDDGKTELNGICSKHVAEFHPQETTKFNYGGVEIKDGLLRLVFAKEYYGVDTKNITEPDVISQALEDAKKKGPSGTKNAALGLRSRRNIRDTWDPIAESLRESIGKVIGLPDIQLLPNFEANAATVAAWVEENKKTDFGRANDASEQLDEIGRVTKMKFEKLREYLVHDKFGEDDMLQEAIQEAISSKSIGFRVLNTLEKNEYAETVFKDGVMWMQTTPRYFDSNSDQLYENIIDGLE